MSGSRALQKVLKVAYLGPEYSFSHLAAVERFGQAVEFMRVGSIAAVFEEVNRGHADFGVVPLENSTDGRSPTRSTCSCACRNCKICAEVRLRIHHNLLANCEQQEIRRVYSKPQALSQCRNWLSKNVPHAAAARGRQHRHRRGAGPAASRAPPRSPAGRRRSTTACASCSPTSRTRPTTRRASPSSATQECGRDRPRQDRPHVPGRRTTPARWSSALDVFKQNKINLTWIESFPAKSAEAGVRVLRRLRGPRRGPEGASAPSTALEEHCEQLTVLGSFPIATDERIE